MRSFRSKRIKLDLINYHSHYSYENVENGESKKIVIISLKTLEIMLMCNRTDKNPSKKKRNVKSIVIKLKRVN